MGNFFKERILSHTEKLYFYVMIIFGLEKRYYEKFFTTELTENSEKKSYTRTLKNLHLDHREISQRNTEIKIIFISKNLY